MAKNIHEIGLVYAHTVGNSPDTIAAAQVEFDDAIIEYGSKVAMRAVKIYLLKTAQNLAVQGEMELATTFFLKSEEFE